MGSSESKLSVASTPKPEPEAHRCISTLRHSEVMDPRSPSTRIDRTPIQVTGTFSKTSVEENSECPQQSFDPRSPTVGVVRTPARDGMRETVGSFARRLGMLFQSEVSDQVPQGNFLPPCLNMEVQEEEEVVLEGEAVVGIEQSSGGPLLSRQPSKTLTSMAEHATLLTTPVLPIDCVGSSSPFVILEKAEEEEAHMNTEDLSVEEAEEAKESPLHKRLSMSLITCHEGAPPAQVFTEVQVHVGPTSPHLARDANGAPTGGEEEEEERDHSPAVPAVTVDAETPPCPAQAACLEVAAANDAPLEPTSPERPEEEAAQEEEEEAQAPAGEQLPTDTPQCAAAAATTTTTTTTLSLPVQSGPAPSCEQPRRPSAGIQCPTFDPRSPSQVVFKPQWLGKGFGTAGLRARGVRASKGGSSPLAVRVTVNNVNNENKGKSTKTKKRANGLSEGRSPLQMLKNNSPRDKPSQMKLKASTPERQRPGQAERRVLTVALDQENR